MARDAAANPDEDCSPAAFRVVIDELLNRVIAAYPLAKQVLPQLRMVVVARAAH